MKEYRIPASVFAYPNGTPPPEVDGDFLTFEAEPEVIVDVVLWARYPSYDMIFGVPRKGTDRHEKEIGFFMFRRIGRGQHGHWFDITEMAALMEGAKKIIAESKTNSEHLWKEHGL